MPKILRNALIVLAITSLAASAADNTLGVWKLNTEKSKYTPGAMPVKSLTVVRAASDGGVKVTTTGEQANGTPINTTYVAKYDGSPTSVTGENPLYDTISITQVDANTLTDERKKTSGSYRATGRTVVSDDRGKLTVTTKGFNADGKEFTSTFVYEKQ